MAWILKFVTADKCCQSVKDRYSGAKVLLDLADNNGVTSGI